MHRENYKRTFFVYIAKLKIAQNDPCV